MNLIPVSDPQLKPYGEVIQGYGCAELLRLLETTPRPAEGTVYEPCDATLNALPVQEQLRRNLYGGMAIQIGYCNGSNRALNCLEYHRGSETIIAAEELVLILARLPEMENGVLDTRHAKCFTVPAGTVVRLHETTLHYAPANAPGKDGFRAAILLPEGTNTPKEEAAPITAEDHFLFARNKWLLAHPDAPEVQNGARVGLTGENIVLPG